MNCWSCHKELELPLRKKIGFKETCPSCDAYLHSCKGCQFHDEGKPNQCKIPGTEQVQNREGANFCEEFVPCTPFSIKDSPLEGRKKFDDLFK